MDAPIDFTDQHDRIDALIAHGNYAEAFALATQLLDLRPPVGVIVNLRWARAKACLALADWKQAETEWTQVLALVPDDPEAHQGRGTAREHLGAAAGAQDDFVLAAKLRRELRNNRSANTPDTVWDRVTAIYAEDLKTRRGKPLGVFGINGQRSHSRTADWAHVEAACTRAIERNPKKPKAYYRRAFVNYCMRNWDALISDCTRALELQPNFADAYNLRGSGYDRKGDLVRAIADWTRAIELKPEDPRAYSLRGFAYDQLGNEEMARADILSAYRLNNPPARA